MDRGIFSQGDTYHIRVKGAFVHFVADWFNNITIIPEKNDETLLVGSFIDQPALRGFLDQLWNLNMTVISVERMEREYPPEERRKE